MIIVISDSLLSNMYMRADTEECLLRENMRTPVPIPQAVHASPCFPKNSTFSSKGENA